MGDAFVTTASESGYAAITQSPEMHGPPRYCTIDWPAARQSVACLCRLRPQLVVTGQGRAMQGSDMLHALDELSRDFGAVAIPRAARYAECPARADDGSAYRPT